MKKTPAIMLLLILTALLSLIAAPASVQAASAISAVRADIFTGEKITLKISGTVKPVRWSSADKTVAAVTTKGVVTGKKPGSTTIIAKVGARTFRCAVTVKKAVNLGKYIGKKFSAVYKAFPEFRDQSRHGGVGWTDGKLWFGGQMADSGAKNSRVSVAALYSFRAGYSIYGVYPGMKKAEAVETALAGRWTLTGDYRWGRVSFRNVSGRELYVDISNDKVISVTVGKWEDD